MIVYVIPDLPRKTSCVSNVTIISGNTVPVGMMTLDFSKSYITCTCTCMCAWTTNLALICVNTFSSETYDIQHCNVTTDHTSILVECTFAINSTASGFVLLHNELGQHNINRTLQRLGDLSEFVNISGLPAGEYNVTVFDQEEDYNKSNPAFEFTEHLKIVAHVDHHPSSAVTAPTYMYAVPGL